MRDRSRSLPLVLLSERLGPVTAEEQRIEAAGLGIVRGAPLWSIDDVRAGAPEAAVIILGAVEPFDAAVLDALPGTKAIVRRGVGVDNVDLEAASRLGIVVANVPDASVDEVSDHALALLLAAERRVVELDRLVRADAWTGDPAAIARARGAIRPFGSLTLGILGFGRIGRALARKAKGIYARVIAADPMVDSATASELGVELVPTDDLLAEADHLSLHLPMSTGNAHLFDAGMLSRLRPGAVLVNTARGGLIDEDALVAALGSRVGAAGLDVVEHEPLVATSPLASQPGVILTAHSAMASTHATAALASRSVDAAIDLLQGRRPSSIANPDVLGSTALRIPTLRDPALS